MVSTLVALGLMTPQLYLIPTPRTVVTAAGEFPLDRRAEVHVTDKSHAASARDLIDESPASFGTSYDNKKLAVYVTRIGEVAGLDEKLKQYHLVLPAEASDESYILSVRPREVICAGKSEAGVFYAVQTLKQLVRANRVGDAIPCVDIVDWPALKIRGWQDDISRGPIPTLAFLKKEVQQMSEYKLNAFTLYTEHVFKLKKHPTIAPADGITTEEVRELDAYCRERHVQLIGNFQSFGHFANILSVPGYQNLAETPNVITPAKEESYQFLKDVYDEIAPAYSSPLFNINCDETYGLGEGPAKAMVEKEGLGNVYAGHINRVASLLKAHQKTVMMWGDIALQYPDIRKNLPKDLVVLTWGYDPRKSFDDQIEPFTKIGFKFLVCPGVSCWGQIFPDLDAATVNISNFVRDGVRFGAEGMLNTTWDDTGENLFNNNWYPLAWGAEVSWNPAIPAGEKLAGADPAKFDQEREARLAAFDDSFPRLFFGLPDGSLSKTFWQLSRLRQNPLSYGMSDQAFWRLPWDLDASANTKAQIDSFGNSLNEVWQGLHAATLKARFNAEALDATMVAYNRAEYLVAEAATVAEIHPVAGRDSFPEASDNLSFRLSWLRKTYADAWNLENRPWWLDRNLAKFDRAIASVKGLDTVPLLTPKGGTFQKPIQVTVGSLKEVGTVRYTLNGTEPDSSSPQYTGPIELTHSAKLRATRFMPDGSTSPTMAALYTFPLRPCHIETSWNHYGDNVPELAFDGLDDTYFWTYGQPSQGSTFTVTLDSPQNVSSFSVVTGAPDHPDDYVHAGVVEVSPDGTRWKEIGQFDKGVAKGGPVAFPVKAVRIRLTKDNGNWLVIREITLN